MAKIKTLLIGDDMSDRNSMMVLHTSQRQVTACSSSELNAGDHRSVADQCFLFSF